MGDEIKLVIDNAALEKYNEYYFTLHPKAKIPPIKHPYHESINTWMVLQRAAMNSLKQKWKDFIKWLVVDQGYANLLIEKCEITQVVHYPTNRRHDTDNSVPKFILDGLVESGMVVDDDCNHITRLTLECHSGATDPRTELTIHYSAYCRDERLEELNDFLNEYQQNNNE